MLRLTGENAQGFFLKIKAEKVVIKDSFTYKEYLTGQQSPIGVLGALRSLQHGIAYQRKWRSKDVKFFLRAYSDNGWCSPRMSVFFTEISPPVPYRPFCIFSITIETE